MKTSLAVKSLIGIGVGGGIIGGSAYALMTSNTKNAIAEELTKNKYKILTSNSENQSHWVAILKSYKGTTLHKDLKFANFDGNEEEAQAVAKLQQKCNELLKPTKDSVLDNKNYKKAEKWCVRPVSISEILKERGATILNVDTSDKTKHDAEWKSKITEHRKTTPEIKKLDGLSIGTSEAISEDHINSIKNKCKSIGDQKNHEEKYEETLENFKTWCSNK